MIPTPAIEFETAVVSEPGGRSENQDCAAARQAGAFSCWALADGLGGHHGGAIAAQLAIDVVLREFAKQPGCSPELVRGYLEAANSAVHGGQCRNPRLQNMRSTAVALVAGGNSAMWGYIGDTRLYYFRAGRVAFQTRDHSVPQALVDSREIAPEQIRFHEDRSRLLRSLGTGESLRPTLLDAPQPLSPSDAFLLCTDGFWEFVTEEQMEADLAASDTSSEWLRRMRARLAQVVPPDHDNYSAIAILAIPPGAR